MAAEKDINQLVGQRLRELRISRGLSQQDVARHLAVTFQQVQKYEGGTNRLSLVMLLKFLELVKIEAAEFLQPLELYHLEETDKEAEQEMTRMTYQLARNFHRIKNKSVQRKVSELVGVLAKN
jgi:transcriptional regulator with XRE-family HTH domain